MAFDSVDGYDVDEGLINQMGLSPAGRDANGNRVWTDDDGHEFTSVQLQGSGGGGNGSGNGGNSPDLGRDYGSASYNPINDNNRNFGGMRGGSPFDGNGFTNPVTNTPFFSGGGGGQQPPGSVPGNSTNRVSKPNPFAGGFGSGFSNMFGGGGMNNPVLASAGIVTHLGALSSGPLVTSGRNALKSTGPVLNIEVEKVGEYGGYYPDDNNGCTSLLYVLNKEGTELDSAAEEFFNIMNDRAGGIFKLCKKGTGEERGKVVLKENKSTDDVHHSSSVSQVLACVIDDAIKGGAYGRKIKLKVLPVGDRDGREQILFDDYISGYVDLEDFKNLLKIPPVRPQRGRAYAREILQAAFIGHIIYERYSSVNYQQMAFSDRRALSNENIHNRYVPAHENGVKKECEIVKEMTNYTNRLSKPYEDAQRDGPPPFLLNFYYDTETFRGTNSTPVFYYQLFFNEITPGQPEPNFIGSSHFNSY